MAADQAGINFVDDTERELFAQAVLAEDVRTFLRSHPVGRYLHERAKAEILAAQQ